MPEHKIPRNKHRYIITTNAETLYTADTKYTISTLRTIKLTAIEAHFTCVEDNLLQISRNNPPIVERKKTSLMLTDRHGNRTGNP